MPNQPYLDPTKTYRDGLAFLGLSLSRKSDVGHPDSVTHQTAFDLNLVQDRDYENVMSSNDDGWLVGGGEPGPPKSYKLAAKDSAHVEIMRIGTYNVEWGGITVESIIDAIQSGQILIPQIEVIPTGVEANPDTPPELEIRFDMEPKIPPTFNDEDYDANNEDVEPLPINWSLRFIQNQLFKYFNFPSRFTPGPFHSTILRKADWRSPEHKKRYFKKCDEAISMWRTEGPKPLNTGWDIDGSQLDDVPKYCSGIWLFTDRNNISHFFKPNFLPPYNTPDKRKYILHILKEEWDQDDLQWKPIGKNIESLSETPRPNIDIEISAPLATTTITTTTTTPTATTTATTTTTTSTANNNSNKKKKKKDKKVSDYWIN